MVKQVNEQILKIEENGLNDIELLALVTDTSYEIIFYATYNGNVYQSNELAESGILSHTIVDKIYSDLASVIRQDKKFDPYKLNIIKASTDKVGVEYTEKNAKIYALKKEWKSEIGR